MLILGMITAFLAAALHVFIFYIESFAWTTRALSVFGIDRESAEVTEEMAFNQGFYNLFLAIEVFGSMLAAALLLFVTSPDKRSAAIKQSFLPLIAVAALL